MRRDGRYGSFLAQSFDPAEVPRLKSAPAPKIEIVKIELTRVIDFENGLVKGDPQFNESETAAIVNAAHSLSLKTFVHCRGSVGLRIAVAAGVDSIEYGFFMEPEILEVMAENKSLGLPAAAGTLPMGLILNTVAGAGMQRVNCAAFLPGKLFGLPSARIIIGQPIKYTIVKLFHNQYPVNISPWQ